MINLANWTSSVIPCLTVWDGSYFGARSLVARNPFRNQEKVIMREFRRIAAASLYTIVHLRNCKEDKINLYIKDLRKSKSFVDSIANLIILTSKRFCSLSPLILKVLDVSFEVFLRQSSG